MAGDVRFRMIEDLFHAALEHGPGYLREACGGDAALREDVEALLESYGDWSSAVPLAVAPSLPRFGPYQCDAILGSGGMGTVYRAHRDDGQFSQAVAIKVLRGSLRSPWFLQRFLTERQMLARLNHPGIARLHDGGTTEQGEPYLVMELVEGEPIDQFCKARGWGLRERLELFCQVVDAVEYAHRSLVVHRDLKPANILVTREGVAKLVDFGTSKLADDRDTVTSMRALTPKYASPEQLRGEPANLSDDIFSAGVVMHELATGESPFGGGDAWKTAMARAAADFEIPVAVPGDLGQILRKALQPKPEARYASAAHFAGDIRAFLEQRPVSAQAPTAWYVASKFLRRHWLTGLGVATMVLGLTAAALYSYGQARVARRNADRAYLATRAMQQLIESSSALSDSRDIRLSELGLRSEAAIAQADPAIRPAMLTSLAMVSVAAGNVEVAERQARAAVAEAVLSKDSLAEARALNVLARMLAYTKPAEALPHARRALMLANAEPDSLEVRFLRFQANGLVGFASLVGPHLEADTEARLLEAIRLGKRDAMLRTEMTSVYWVLADFYASRKEDAKELQALNDGLAVYRKLPHPTLVDALILQREEQRLMRIGDFSGAERIAREHYELALRIAGPNGVVTIGPRVHWAVALSQIGDWTGASRELAACRTALEGFPTGARALSAWRVFFTSAVVENRVGNAVGAEALARAAVKAGTGLNVAMAYREVGIALRQQGKFKEALAELGEGRSIVVASHGDPKDLDVEIARVEAGDRGLPRRK